ncbi:AsnC family transcriptional regulator [bacterium SCN 62-11]|nr:Lrp/AsnC family transcriptional regulator [Candidatus Eremiobacteraeota bacterium]ODT56947.1 MAG: AsnC family transcriptional regulator [bacterium SCN 62-11]
MQLSLDILDLRLLSAVQQDGALSNVELAERVNLSASQCARRLERLKREGYIDRVVTMLNPLKFGLTILVHTAISLRRHDTATNTAFKEFVCAAPEVLECYAQTGDADFLLKILVRNLSELNEFFDRLLNATGGVGAMQSGVVMSTIKQTTAIPL